MHCNETKRTQMEGFQSCCPKCTAMKPNERRWRSARPGAVGTRSSSSRSTPCPPSRPSSRRYVHLRSRGVALPSVCVFSCIETVFDEVGMSMSMAKVLCSCVYGMAMTRPSSTRCGLRHGKSCSPECAAITRPTSKRYSTTLVTVLLLSCLCAQRNRDRWQRGTVPYPRKRGRSS